MTEKCERCGRESRMESKIEKMCLACGHGYLKLALVDELTGRHLRNIQGEIIREEKPLDFIGVAYMVRTWHYKQYNPFKTMKHANDLIRQIQNTSEYISDLCYVCYWDEEKQELVSLHGQIPPHYDELHPTDEITIKPRKEVPLPPFPFITDELLPPSLRDEDLEMDPDGEDFDFDYDEYDDDDGEWEEVC